MSKPYREGNGWAYRLRKSGVDEYQAGFATEAAARKGINKRLAELAGKEQPVGVGPHRTSLAMALSDFARQHLPFLKGAKQEANRINQYLRCVGLPVIQVKALDDSCVDIKLQMKSEASDSIKYWRVELAHETGPEDTPGRVIPNSLRAHRESLQEHGQLSQRVRQRLARRNVADITCNDLQELVDAMKLENYAPATVALERAMLRGFFNHCKKRWSWSAPRDNPASGLNVGKVDNARTRTLSAGEWLKLGPTLAQYENPFVFPLCCLMIETGMRSGEPLTHARWGDVRWEDNILCLRDSKTGAREVPLGPGAMEVLSWMRETLGKRLAKRIWRKHGVRKDPFADDSPLFETTYEAAKKAWSQACKLHGLENLHLHDLRHTAGTRYHRELNGDLLTVMVVTGHKTYVSAQRYVNQTTKDVALRLHGREVPDSEKPAGLGISAMTAALQEIARTTSGVVLEDDHDGIETAKEGESAGGPPDALDASAITASNLSMPLPSMHTDRPCNVIAVNFKSGARGQHAP
jgi:integrase